MTEIVTAPSTEIATAPSTGDLIAQVRRERSFDAHFDARLARAIREMAGVSRARLGAEIGVSATSVFRWETGRRKPRGEYLRRYIELLDQLREASR
jgi:DNA-binding transcriptional regulator YiaG